MPSQPDQETILINLVIDLAWADEVSFDEIKSRTGYTEPEVIKLMRRELKSSSFKMWRKRVSGRKTKHAQRLNPATENPAKNRANRIELEIDDGFDQDL